MSAKPKPAFLLARGRTPLPEVVELPSGVCRLEHVFKHDFFAATALYRGESEKVVVKFGRRASLFGLPMGWIGRWHARHETRLYLALADLDVVPAFRGPVGRDGFAHAYVEGSPLHRGRHVPDDFFPRLAAALAVMHARQIAYVDLEKCENVLVGDDGRPYLIDFQISFLWPWRWGGSVFPISWIRRRLQHADLYHLRKLQRRTRPDQLSAEALRATYQRPWYVRLHGWLTRPLTRLRRRLLNRIDPEEKRGERGRVHVPPGNSSTGGSLPVEP